MMRYLFIGIPSLLFEPIAVGALLGVAASFLVYRKKHERFYWMILSAIVFLLFWRLSMHTLMLSTRYASILLYPAIIFTVWFCFYLRDIVQWLLARFPHLKMRQTEWLGIALPFLFIAGLTIVSTVKILHYNPYGKHTVKLCRILSEEIAGKDFHLYTLIEPDRIAYYTGLDIQKVQFIIAGDTSVSLNESLIAKIASAKNCFENFYFIFYQKKGMPEPDQKTLGIPAETGKWECLHREYTSRRKNKEMVLYRFIPAHPNIEIWEKEIPEMSPGNVCLNGDFEKYLTGKALEQRLAYYRKLGASDFYTAPGRLFPTTWWLGVVNNGENSFPEMALTGVNPIAGKYSLELGTNQIGWGMNSTSIPKQNGTFSGFIRAESDAVIRLWSCYWDTDQKKTAYMNIFESCLQTGKIYRFSFPVYKQDVPDEDKSIYIIVSGSGHVLVDNVEFIPEQNNIQLEVKK